MVIAQSFLTVFISTEPVRLDAVLDIMEVTVRKVKTVYHKLIIIGYTEIVQSDIRILFSQLMLLVDMYVCFLCSKSANTSVFY